MTITNGLYVPRERTCPCGAVFVAKRPEARYCSNACRLSYTRYGRAYGTVVPRQLGWTK